MQKPRLALTMGDPAGIGPEIILHSLRDRQIMDRCDLLICGSARVFQALAPLVGLDLAISEQPGGPPGTELPGVGQRYWLGTGQYRCELWEPDQSLVGHDLTQCPPEATSQCFDLLAGRQALQSGRVMAGYGLLAYLSISLAHRACAAGYCQAMVTAPIHKEALRAAGVPHIGHTEILGSLCGVADPLTMFETLSLRIFFHSRHVSLRHACDLVRTDRVLDSLRRCHLAMASLGLPSRRIAVAGLNPHCGEHGLFGNEDDLAVLPAVAAARAEGIDAYGPIGADSVFHQAKTGQWDAVLSLYHDQGHIAAKTLDFDRTISITLGLPYLRSSVDHGTAMDIAGTNAARPASMVEALRVALTYSLSRA